MLAYQSESAIAGNMALGGIVPGLSVRLRPFASHVHVDGDSLPCSDLPVGRCLLA